MRRKTAWVASVIAVASAVLYVWTQANGPDIARLESPGGPAAPIRQDADRGNDRLGPKSATAHPLLREADSAILAEGSDEFSSTPGLEITEMIRTVARSGSIEGELASLAVDYPHDATVFPPEIVPPTFLWHEPTDEADTWLIDLAFGSGPDHIYVLSAGWPPPAARIDRECIAPTNEVYKPTAYQASAKSWTPCADAWASIQRRSAGRAAAVTIVGFRSAKPAEVLSRGRITITTSPDPVGAPIFYRDVPLAPTMTEKGVIKPLGDDVVTRIAWRLRDISLPESRLLLTGVPRCTNCHSFSADGKTLGMDLDGPQSGKSAYIIAPTARHMVIEKEDVIRWDAFPGKLKDHNTIGFLSQVSPDGRYAVTTVNEEVYVTNFLDFRFLQVFYPTRGILAYYSRETGEIKSLPGADDPKFVHCDAVWSPDGRYLVFARAEAKDAYPENGKLAQYANDPTETPIQYDLCRIPFDGGRGGRPEPIVGASNNGMSNSFPKISPDGKWIVFVQCRNGQLMRPDSKLWIVPAAGGEARLMRCNTSRMNSWHSFSPNSRWMVFSSKVNTPYTQMFLTHIDENGNDSPAVLIPNSTAANRAVNIPEFVNLPYEELLSITMPAVDYRKYVLRGEAMAKKGMLDEAVAEFDMAVRIKPDFLEGRVNAAILRIDQGMLDEAAVRLNRVLEMDPQHAKAHCSLGVVLGKQGKLDEAIAHFETSLKLKPDDSAAHANLGRALQQKGMLEEATTHFRKALELQSEDPLGHFRLATVLLARGMLEEAVQHLRRVLQIDPQFVDARLMLGNVLAAQGQFDGALAQFQETIAADPDNLTAINCLARLLAACPNDSVRDGPRAVRLIESACKATGYRDPILLSTLAAAYAEVGKFPEAIATATRALSLVAARDRSTAHRIRRELEGYQSGRRCRDWPNRPPNSLSRHPSQSFRLGPACVRNQENFLSVSSGQMRTKLLDNLDDSSQSQRCPATAAHRGELRNCPMAVNGRLSTEGAQNGVFP
ncbi:MAG: tetratricopeptide repeat protein [Pirellulales bacterium]|nr:tetratricopeptide repeat protein [Pirellulales bacterium]